MAEEMCNSCNGAGTVGLPAGGKNGWGSDKDIPVCKDCNGTGQSGKK